MKTGCTRTARLSAPANPFSHLAKTAIIIGAAWAGAMTEPVAARPSGQQVVRGNVTFERSGNRTIIRASDGSIISYLNFNIGANETVRFIQPGEWARVLNRITGPDPSVIAGRLLANGQVYIVNPAGVYFTNGSIVNVGGIYAAAGNLTNARFLAGKNKFTDLSGSVVNEGEIRGGSINLVGEHVANHGTIKSPRGVIAMVAGDEVVIRQHGERVMVKVDGVKLTDQKRPQHGEVTADMLAAPAVENTGRLSANKGTVMLGAGDMYALAVRNSGRISAARGDITVAASDGLIHNTQSGVIRADAKRGEAGSVILQAPSILNSGAITADAHQGEAGYVEVTSQKHTYMTRTGVVSASGLEGNASGGEVLMHSYHGQTALAKGSKVDVSGGKLGGDGGFAEVSGETLVFEGRVNLRAKRGYDKATLLIDPHHITIINDTTGFDHFLNDNIITFNEPNTSQDIYISDDALEALFGHIILQATGDITVAYPVHLVNNNDVTFEAQKNIFFNEPITGMHNFSGTADIDGNGFGDVFLSAPLSISGNARFNGVDTFLNNFTIESGGSQDYFGPVDLCVDMTLQASNVHFHSTLNDTIAGAQSLTINGPGISNAVAVFDGPVGGLRKLESLAVNGSSTINGSLVLTKDFQKYLGPVELNADTTMTSTDAGEIRFGDTLDGEHHLLVETAGLTRFDGDAGKLAKLESITTDAPGTTRLGGDINAGVIDLNDPVTLAADVTLDGSESVDFAQTIAGQEHDLIINSPQTGFHGDATDLDLLQTDAAGKTDIQADITGNKLDFNDTVVLLSDSILTGRDFVDFDKTVDGQFNLTTNSDHLVRFGGDVGGNVALQSLTTNVGSPDLIDQNLVVIDGNVIRVRGDIRFNPAGRSGPAKVATIAARDSGGVQIRSLQGEIFMGPNEKLTSLGDLRLSAANGSMTLGDLNSAGDMIVNSPDIRIRSRNAGSILNSSGEFIGDDGADFVAGGKMRFSSAPAVIGSGEDPIFATRSGKGFSQSLSGFEKKSFLALRDQDFTFGSTVLDLTPLESSPPPPPPPPPPSPQPPTELATALDHPPTRVEDRVLLDPFALRPMERLAIYLRTLRPDELRDKLAGRELYNDAPESPAVTPQERGIAVNRLRRNSVIKSLDQYRAIFMKEVPADQQTGETPQQDQAPFIKSALAKAWTSYLDRQAAATNGNGQLDPAAFRAFLQSDPAHAEALAYFDGLRDLFQEIWIMGATRLELRNSVNGVLKPIVPEGMQQEQLEQVLQINTLG